jgi:hypothetical protein
VAHHAHKPAGINLTTVMMITALMAVTVQLELTSTTDDVSNEANVHVNSAETSTLHDPVSDVIVTNASVLTAAGSVPTTSVMVYVLP